MSEIPEAGQKKGWFQRLTSGLQKSSRQFTDNVVSTFVKKPLDTEALDNLEDLLIQADLGVDASARIVEAFSEERFGAGASDSYASVGGTDISGTGRGADVGGTPPTVG